jgi:dTDP-4-dehydrorhamnose 3,5-epimerase
VDFREGFDLANEQEIIKDEHGLLNLAEPCSNVSQTCRFNILPTSFYGLLILQHEPIRDSRGYLERMFCTQELQNVTAGRHIFQINHTFTAKAGIVRGMHFQYPPHMEMKLVSCLRGEVFDVAVDIRSSSPTFLQWYGEILSPDNHKTMIIPEGFAHGFQTLTPDCEMLYFHTASYHPGAEGGLHPLDPRLKIDWPLPIAELSERDAAHPRLTDNFQGVSAYEMPTL